MKRLLLSAAAVLLAALTALAFAGCSKKPGESAKPTEPAATGAASHSDSAKKHEKDDEQSGADKRENSTPAPTSSGSYTDIGSQYKSQTYIVKSEDCFEGAGYCFFVAGCDAKYTVEVETGTSKVNWEIYVLPDKFTDAERYIANAYTPALTGNGTITVEKNNYIYIHCSVNSFSASSPAEGAKVTFVGYGLPQD